jgi:hypothetical protein
VEFRVTRSVLVELVELDELTGSLRAFVGGQVVLFGPSSGLTGRCETEGCGLWFVPVRLGQRRHAITCGATERMKAWRAKQAVK